MVVVAVLTSAGSLMIGSPEAVSSSYTFSTYPAPMLRPKSLSPSSSLSVNSFFTEIFDKMSIRGRTQIVLGIPSHFDQQSSNLLRSSLTWDGKISNPTIIDSSLLAAYACARGTCLVVEIFHEEEDDDTQLSFSICPIIEYTQLKYHCIICKNLVRGVKECLRNVDLDKHPALLDNLILTGPAWTATLEEDIVGSLKKQLAAVSSYPSDSQIRTVTARHIPEYHSELLKSAGPDVQKTCAIFGAAISCKALLGEAGK